MDERRKFPRLNFSVQVNWEKIETVKQTGEFQSKNISGGGLCLFVDNTIKLGDKIKIDIHLPSGKIIEVKGKVVWVESIEMIGDKQDSRPEAGIEFFDISDEIREEIKKFVIDPYRQKGDS